MPGNAFFHACLIGLLAAGVVLPGCSDEASPRSAVTIETINNNQTLDSDVYNNGEDREMGTPDDFIIEDQVPIAVRNRPQDLGLSIRANGPYGAVVFHRYEVHFEGDETLPSVVGALHLRVLSGSTATGEVTIVPASFKSAQPLRALWTGGEMRFQARIVLIGEEEDSLDEIRAEARLPVHFANWGDPD